MKNQANLIVEYEARYKEAEKKTNELIIRNRELAEWMQQIEIKNDELQKENELLRKVLKEVL